MKKVLLSGAGGFIGKNTVPFLLEKGYEVHGLGRGPRPGFLKASVHWHRIDLLDLQATRTLVASLAATHLLHLAWYTVHEKFWTAEENRQWVDASFSLLAGFGKNGGQRAVFAGTCAEYDWSQGTCSEDQTPLMPASLYGICKNSLREKAERYAGDHAISFAWGRLFFLYGPAEQEGRLVPSVVSALMAGQPAKCTHGRQVRDFLYVEDAASAFVALLDSNIQEPVNIASGNPIELRTLIDMIAQDIGRPELVQWGAITVSENDPPRLTANTDKLRDRVRWNPQYPLQKGIAATIKNYRKETDGHS
ncbi:MAG: NAD(P)-dependent oxidoreductase [Nitrospinota bacterium]|nr:NAD(P)-dependent oxidoreductase [Nitrospinota bacterium]